MKSEQTQNNYDGLQFIIYCKLDLRDKYELIARRSKIIQFASHSPEKTSIEVIHRTSNTIRIQ